MVRKKREPCDYCDGVLRPKKVTVVRHGRRGYVVIENVPANICNRCGMRYFDAPAVRNMERILRKRVVSGRKIEVRVTEYEVVA